MAAHSFTCIKTVWGKELSHVCRLAYWGLLS